MASTPAIRFAAIGAGVGLTGGLVYTLSRRAASKSKNEDLQGGNRRGHSLLGQADLQYLQAHDDMYSKCLDLARFRHHSPSDFRAICVGLNQLLMVAAEARGSNASTVKRSWPGQARRARQILTSSLSSLEDSLTATERSEFGESCRSHPDLRGEHGPQRHSRRVDENDLVESD